jgi:hypothetical protein
MSQNNDLENSRPENSNMKTANLESVTLESVTLEIVTLEIVADGRFLGLSAGDWTLLIGGFGLSALAVLLL